MECQSSFDLHFPDGHLYFFLPTHSWKNQSQHTTEAPAYPIPMFVIALVTIPNLGSQPSTYQWMNGKRKCGGHTAIPPASLPS
jgi:hypothetical protein